MVVKQALAAAATALVAGGLVSSQGGAEEGALAPIGVRHWSHVILHVADIEASLGFYRDFLGAEVFTDDAIGGADFEKMIGVPGARARIVNLVLGGQKVELIALLGVPAGPPAARVGRGLAGFAIRVEDIEAAWQCAGQLGIGHGGPPTEIEGFRQFMVIDPDGVHVEISQPPPDLERFGPFSGRPGPEASV